MSPIPNLRTPLACGLMFSLIVAGLITLTTRQGHASNNSLRHSLTPTVNQSSEKTAPQAKIVDNATRKHISEAYGKLPLSFEENRGQVDSEVKYISRGAGYTLFLTPTEAVLALRNANEHGRNETASGDLSNPQSARIHPQSARTQSAVLRMKLSGANTTPAVTGESEMSVKTNYFKGNDPAKWHTDVACYERVRYAQVYPGIDMIYYGEQRQLEYDFEVAPFADAHRIALEFAGVKRVKIERGTGDLLLKTAGGEVRQHKPIAYQEVGGERQEVASRYVVKGRRQVALEVGEYDRTRPLVIDPSLSYSTYLGGDSFDFGYSIAVDASGYVYVTGATYSTDFPVLNEYQTLQYADVFVTKLDTNASGAASLLYSTYLGGSDEEQGYGIAVDSSGNAYVTGYTYSTDFPLVNEYQTYQGDVDAFVTKLDTNASGAAALLYSTYYGYSGYDWGQAIAVDSSGIVYVTGVTSFFDSSDVFVAQLDTNVSGDYSLLYDNYWGGYSGDTTWGYGIAIDASGYIYVTGYTDSFDFPIVNGEGLHAYDDVFVTKLDPYYYGSDSIIYSTCLGGSDFDYGYGIAVDSSGIAYVTGYTQSADFPVLNQYQTYRVGDAFVAKLDTNADGTASLLYSTYLGGSDYDEGRGIAVDSSGMAYVTGYTYSTDFPKLNPYQTHKGGSDAFVTKLNTNSSGAASLLYSTYVGGSDDEGPGFFPAEAGYGIAIDSTGNAYVVGYTDSGDFPVRNQYQTDQPDNDVFVIKLTINPAITGRVTSDGTNGIGGVAVKLGGSQSRTVVTNSTGYYSFPNVARSGNYTVTPSKSGITFIPSQQSIPDLQADQMGVNFTAPPATISGKVTKDTADGAGVPGVTITLARGGSTYGIVSTASDGTYSFSDVPVPGNYTLTASNANNTFSPAQLFLNNLTMNQVDQNFVERKNYAIIGVVRLGAARLPGVTVTLTSPAPAGFSPQTTTTNSGGAYSFNNLPPGRRYTVTPMMTGYQFTPASKSLAPLSANQTGVDFAVKDYSITGRITRTATTTGIGNVAVRLTSPSPANFPDRTVLTSSAGIYTFTTLPAGRNYTIKAVKSGFTFTPATRSITNLSMNIPAGASTNFTSAGP